MRSISSLMLMTSACCAVSGTGFFIRADVLERAGGWKWHLLTEDIEFSNKAHETIPCQYEGDAMDIGFNAKFLTEMLTNLDSEQVLIEMSHPSRAGIIFPYYTEEKEEKNDDILMLVMPVMLAN